MSNKGYKGKNESYAAGGAARTPQKSWAKEGNVKNPTNTAEEKPSHGAFGALLGGIDRFTSANIADSGEPANVRRTKPDEDWSKDKKGYSVKLDGGASKSEKPIKPRS